MSQLISLKYACCSSHVICSVTYKCVHLGDPEYAECALFRRLVREGKMILEEPEPVPVEVTVERKKPTHVYLCCYKSFFAIVKRTKYWYSGKLTEEDAARLIQAFHARGIPYKTEIDVFDCEVDKTEEIRLDDRPCDSRVILVVDGEEYNILNFDYCLIKNTQALKITEAFKNKGFESRTEAFGTNSSRSYAAPPKVQQPPRKEPDPLPEPVKVPEPLKSTEAKYVQMTLFDSLLHVS